MAKIIYKQGFEGQNRLEHIEGIEISLLNGQKALIYPKYENAALINRADISKWTAKEENEIKALKKMDNNWDTGELLDLNSPAAEYVSQFSSDGQGIFALPTLLAALEIIDQKKDIDALAKTIEGADLLGNFSSHIWTCSRYFSCGGWSASGGYSYVDGDGLYQEHTVVPVALYE